MICRRRPAGNAHHWMPIRGLQTGKALNLGGKETLGWRERFDSGGRVQGLQEESYKPSSNTPHNCVRRTAASDSMAVTIRSPIGRANLSASATRVPPFRGGCTAYDDDLQPAPRILRPCTGIDRPADHRAFVVGGNDHGQTRSPDSHGHASIRRHRKRNPSTVRAA